MVPSEGLYMAKKPNCAGTSVAAEGEADMAEGGLPWVGDLGQRTAISALTDPDHARVLQGMLHFSYPGYSRVTNAPIPSIVRHIIHGNIENLSHPTAVGGYAGW